MVHWPATESVCLWWKKQVFEHDPISMSILDLLKELRKMRNRNRLKIFDTGNIRMIFHRIIFLVYFFVKIGVLP